MRKFLIIAVAMLGALASSAQAADVQVQVASPTHASKCPHGKCDAFLNRRTSGPVAYDQQTICSTFLQGAPAEGRKVQMMVKFFDENNVELDAGDKLHTKLAGPVGSICPGRHWFEKARRGHVEFCNADNHTSVLRPIQIEKCLSQGTCTPFATNYVSLLGAKGSEEARKRMANQLVR